MRRLLLTAALLIGFGAIGLSAPKYFVPGKNRSQAGSPPPNSPPTLTAFVGPLDSTMESEEVEITFSEFATQGNEADTDGVVLAFDVESVASGTLKIGATSGSATAWNAVTNKRVSTGINAYWIPPPGTGEVNAFTAVAIDDDLAASSPAVQATVQVDGGNAWYVATDGDAGSAGTLADPFELYEAFEGTGSASAIAAGDVVYFRGGTYELDRELECLHNGAAGNRLKWTPHISGGKPEAVSFDEGQNGTTGHQIRWGKLTDAITISVNTSTDEITATAHGLTVGDLFYLTGSLPAPMVSNRSYYVKTAPSANVITVSETDGGATLDLTSTGSGAELFHAEFGNYLWIDGFEAYAQPSTRTTTEVGSQPALALSLGGFVVIGRDCIITNCVLHDLKNGITWQSSSLGGKAEGLVCYNSGWDAPDGRHGHGGYLQNTAIVEANRKTFQHSVWFGNASIGCQFWGASTAADYLTADGITTFYNGERNGNSGVNFLLSSNQRHDFCRVLNMRMYKGTWGHAKVDIGNTFQSGTQRTDIIYQNNFGDVQLRWHQEFVPTVFSGNELNDSDGAGEGANWDSAWDSQVATGYGTWGDRVFVDPFELTTGAVVTIYNESQASSVAVDLSSVLATDTEYEIHSVFDMRGTPVLSGTYSGGTVSVPMVTRSAPQPTGTSAWTVDDTTSEFHSFIVRGFGAAAPNNPPTLTAFSGAVDTTTETTEVEITLADLKAVGDEADSDGTVDKFNVQAVSTGTLKIGANSGSATAWAADTNESITAALNGYWTPAAGTGLTNAFTTLVEDNDGAESTGAVQAQVQVNAAPSVYLTDTFTEASDVGLDQHTPDENPAGNPWVENSGVWTVFGATDDVGCSTSLQVASIDIGQSDYTFTATVNGDERADVIFRFVDTNNFWYIRNNRGGGQWILYRRESGSDTAVITQSFTSAAGSIDIVIVTNGTSIDVTVDGNNANTTSSVHLSGTGVGMRSGTTGARWTTYSIAP